MSDTNDRDWRERLAPVAPPRGRPDWVALEARILERARFWLAGRRHASAWEVLAAALVLGGALGGAGARWVADDSCERRRGRGADAYIERLDQELGLTAEQRASVRDVLARQQEEMSAIWREIRPRADEIKTATRREVNALLTPDQQARYADLLERIDRERERKRSK